MAGLAAVPVFAAAKIAGVDLAVNRIALSHLTAALLAAGSVLFLFLALVRICPSGKRALVFAFAYAFGTEVWAVASRGQWQHGPSIFFLAASFWLLLSGSRRRTALAGMTLGLAVLSRPTDVLFALPAAAFVGLRRRESVVGFLLCAAVPAAAGAIYSATMLGNALAFGQLYRLPVFGGSVLPGLGGLLASPSRGLFVFSPFLLAAVPGSAAALRSVRSQAESDALLAWLAAGTLALILLTSAWPMWWGGTSFGYRLLLDAVPALVLLAARAGETPGARVPAARVAFFALLAFSVFVEALGVFAYPTAFDDRLDLEPSRLWDVRRSELVFASRKLFGKAPPPGAAPAVPAVWWTPGNDDDTIPGWLDASPGGKAIGGPLVLSGWARSAAGDVDVAIVLDGGRIIRPERFPRPDVAAVLPELGDASRTGFRATVSGETGLPRERAFCVEFRDPRGRVRRLGPVRFRWSGS